MRAIPAQMKQAFCSGVFHFGSWFRAFVALGYLLAYVLGQRT